METLEREKPTEEIGGMRDACGVFGCILKEGTSAEEFKVAERVYSGLSSLQHRGEESTGILGSDGQSTHFQLMNGEGLVRDVYCSDKDKFYKVFTGSVLCIGHNRYSTAGMKGGRNCIQPLEMSAKRGWIGVAHNGELVEKERIQEEVYGRGLPLRSDSDSELIATLICETSANNASGDWNRSIYEALKQLTLSYSLLVMTQERMYAIRDPWGNRPLCLGEVKGDDGLVKAWVASSETAALLPIGATVIREVLPGEIVELTPNGISKNNLRLERPKNSPKPALCVFEYVYFSRRDSVMEGQQVDSVRKRCGMELAKECPVDADIVSTVPSSATPAGLGYSKRSGIEYTEVLAKNKYMGRSFIQPSDKKRRAAIRQKFGPLYENFRDKRVIIVDDSIVRGNTMGPIVKLLKEYGAKEVHIRVASPPIKYPCYMGINIPTKQELIAHRMTSEQMKTHFNADSVGYLSVEGLKRAVEQEIPVGREVGHCYACLTNEYPVKKNLGLAACDW